MKELELAAKWCLEAHEHQVDKAGNPYFLHPFSIMYHCKNDNQRIVALLHDVLEDSELINPMDILANFGQEIFDAVVAMTRGKGETYSDYISRISTNKLAKSVKILDLKDNLRNRGYEIPDSLRKRYEKALYYLENNYIVYEDSIP